MKQDAAQIFAEYEKLSGYNQQIGLYETVKKNENFFIGKQWEGVNAPNLDKPVINILKRAVAYFLSVVVSDDVSVSLSGFSEDAPDMPVLDMLSAQFDEVFERAKVKEKNRDALKNAAVDGDGCFYMYFDPNAPAGALTPGAICVDVIDNTNILFANPEEPEVQKQPYLLILMRKTLEQVRSEAVKNGISNEQMEAIRPDDAENAGGEVKEDDKVSVILKLWKSEETGTVHAAKCTRDVILQDEVDLGYRLYPVAYFSWDKVKNSYHGQAAITGLIPNQIFINKLFAMCMEHVKKMAFPKLVYNEDLLPDGLTNQVGEALAVRGDPNMAIAVGVGAADMSAQVLHLIERIIAHTRDAMGATDAALGSVRPDNTSAIIALQRASAMPLELQRMAFYQFIEDYVRVFLDMMRVNYGLRRVTLSAEGKSKTALFDFSKLSEFDLKLNIDVGASAYWSELMQVQTVDNLFARGVISDAVTYLESVPDGYIKNKRRLIEKIKERETTGGGEANGGEMSGLRL